MKKAYAYVRVSSVSQAAEERGGFDRQRAAIDAFTAVNGVEIAGEFSDALGGDNEWADRPGFTAMVDAILGNGVRMIVVENLGRLARAYVVQEHILMWFASKDIDLISADTGENVTKAVKGDPAKKLIIQIMGSFFEYEKNSLVRKLRAARLRRKAETGRCEGRKPYGHYPGEADTLARMKELRRNGADCGGVARVLTKEGRRPREAAAWTAKGVYEILHPKAKVRRSRKVAAC